MSSAIGINNTWTAHLYPREEQWRNGRCTIKCRCAVVATYSFLREPTPPLSPLCVCVSLSGERRIHAGRVPLPPPYYCALLLLLYEGGAGARRRPVVTQSVDAKQECVACFLSHLVRHVKSGDGETSSSAFLSRRLYTSTFGCDSAGCDWRLSSKSSKVGSIFFYCHPHQYSIGSKRRAPRWPAIEPQSPASFEYEYIGPVGGAVRGLLK